MKLTDFPHLIGCIAFYLFLTPSVQGQLFTYTLLDQQVNDIVATSSGLIYASVPSTGGQHGNYIIVVDPYRKSVVGRVFAGSEPNKLALTSDQKFLYVSLDGSGSVKRFVREGLVSDLTFNLGIGSQGPNYAEDLAAIYGKPNLVAVSRRNLCCSPRHEGVAVYDNGVQLPTVTSRTQQTNEIESGDDGVSLYGYNTETSDFSFRRIGIDQNGASITSSLSNSFGAYNLEIRYFRGNVYATNGKIVAASTGFPSGSFAVGGFANGLVLDKWNRRILFIINSQLKVFWLDSMQPVGTADLPTNVHSRARLVRWGRRGIAYRVSDGRLAIAESLLVTQKVGG